MDSPLSRRRFLRDGGRAAAALTLAGAGGPLAACRPRARFDVVIKNGLVFDGFGRPGIPADVGIVDGTIREIGRLSAARGKAVVEAGGLAVSPGFIDIHDHTDVQLLVDPAAESALRQGVTTLIGGNCGSSVAPIADEVLEERRRVLREEYGLELDWRDLGGFFARLGARGAAVNFGTLVGHGSVRGAAMGLHDRAAKPEEMERMRALVEAALKAGALGLSSGLEYTPGSFAEPGELVELCRVTARFGGIYASHMRDEGDSLLEALDETIATARAAGISLEVSHLKTAYPRNWGKIDAALARIDAAKASGLEIGCDRYPYIAGSTDLSFNFPLWARQGSTEEFLSRLKDPYQDSRLRAYVAERERKIGSWDMVLISSVLTEKNRVYEGRTVLEAAKMAGLPPFELMRDLIIEERDNVGMVIFMMSEDNLKRILAHPLVGIGSDGSVRSPGGPLGRGKPHPRVYGTFARAIGKYVREDKVVSLEEMIRKMTSLPARRLRLPRRGFLAPGAAADVVVFDPAKIVDRATWSDPHRFPEGIEAVLVNGQIALEKGAPTGRLPGQILKRAEP